jgi:hypothetical protein
MEDIKELIEEFFDSEEVFLESIPLGDTLRVQTRNSTYFLKNTPDGFLLSGGLRGYKEEIANVHGSTWGGSAIKIGRLVLGMRMELSCRNKSLLTSIITSIRVV